MKAELFRIFNSLKRNTSPDNGRKLEFNTTTLEFIFKHKHCPICGQVIDSESDDAYFHIYTPTRCQKMEDE